MLSTKEQEIRLNQLRANRAQWQMSLSSVSKPAIKPAQPEKPAIEVEEVEIPVPEQLAVIRMFSWLADKLS